MRLRIALFALLFGGTACAPPTADLSSVERIEGVVVGDVAATSAVLWARGDKKETNLVFELDDAADFSSPATFRIDVDPADDFTGQVVVQDLEPAKLYHVRITERDAPPTRFRTAPASQTRAPVRFLVGGDLGGQGHCRARDGGYAIFRTAAQLEPDFFLANGDMIYADSECPETDPEGRANLPGDFISIEDLDDWTPPRTRAEIDAHWRYNRADAAVQDFLAATPLYAQWDDHEVIDDFGAAWEFVDEDRRDFPALAAAGREAFLAYNPIAPQADGSQRIYRSFRWGAALELFILDGRSYRDRNDAKEPAEGAKTMLGDAQRAWLLDGLKKSDATWKVISSNVPLVAPSGDHRARDGWANGNGFGPSGYGALTGFERELREILTFMDRENVENVVFVVTDVHYAMLLRCAVDLDDDGDEFVFHELLSGPLSAKRLTPPPASELDRSFSPEVLYVEGGFFNFLSVRIEPGDENGEGDGFRFLAEIRDAAGEVRGGVSLSSSDSSL